MNYNEYTLPISSDPSHYGDACTKQDAEQIAEKIGALAVAQFPGLNIEIHAMIGNRPMTGPDEAVGEEIHAWLNENWMKAV